MYTAQTLAILTLDAEDKGKEDVKRAIRDHIEQRIDADSYRIHLRRLRAERVTRERDRAIWEQVPA
jgi:hypothetical protein